MHKTFVPSSFSVQIRQKWKILKRLYYKKKQEKRPSGESVSFCRAVGTLWANGQLVRI